MNTIWNTIKAETNRFKETTNIDHNNYQNSLEAFNRYFCQYPKILLMVSEAMLTNMPTLLKTLTIPWETYLMHPFLA